MREDIEVIRQEVRKALKIVLCYPIEIVFWALFPILWVIPFMFQGIALVGSFESPSLGRMVGTEAYIPFLLIGAVVSTYLFSSLYGMGGSFRMESYWGTLEFVLGSPARKVSILMGKGLAESVSSTFFAATQIAISIGLFGVRVALNRAAPLLLTIVLLVAGLWGVAIALAGVTLVIKESRGIVHSLEYLLYLFSPIRYPVEVSTITRMVSVFIPLTYALVVVRSLILLNRPVSSLWPQVAMLAVMDLILVGGGFICFGILERKVRQSGGVSHH